MEKNDKNELGLDFQIPEITKKVTQSRLPLLSSGDFKRNSSRQITIATSSSTKLDDLLVIRILSSFNAGKVQTAINTVKRFLDKAGAWYKHHKSKKSNSEYFLVERPDDRVSPEVDVRVSDHTLPPVYQQPDLDIDPDNRRAGAYSVPEALGLLEGFFDGEYRNIVEGEPIAASFRRFIKSTYNKRTGWWVSPSGEWLNVDNDEDYYNSGHIGWAYKNVPFTDEEWGEILELDKVDHDKADDLAITYTINHGFIRVRAIGSSFLSKGGFDWNQIYISTNSLNKKRLSDIGFWLANNLGVKRANVSIWCQGNTYNILFSQLLNGEIFSSYKSIFNAREMLSGGVWISPSGEIIDTHGSHTSTVLEFPERFGISINEAEQLFSIGEEEAVLQRLLKEGWIRIRFQSKDYYIGVGTLSRSHRLRLRLWALDVIKLHRNRSNVTCIIEESLSYNKIKVLLYNVSIGKFFNDNSLPVHSSADYVDWSLITNKKSNYLGNAEIIESATAKELLDGNSNLGFKHRAEHLAATKAQGDSEIMRCYANTLELRTKSEEFQKNKKYYRQWVLFKDFRSIARDKKIPFDQAVDYSLNFGDVNIRCSCPSQLYHGYSFMGDQLGYLYGLPREGRFPKVQNPNLQNTTCKHVHIALEHILNNKEKIIKMFGVYYKRLDETPPDMMIAVPAKAVEEKEETLEDFLSGFDEDGNEIPKPEGEEEDDEIEEISVTDPDTGVVKIDSKLAEKGLPSDQQVQYAGEEDETPVEEDTLASVADSVSTEEVQELASQIDETSTDGLPSLDNVFTTSGYRPPTDNDYRIV